MRGWCKTTRSKSKRSARGDLFDGVDRLPKPVREFRVTDALDFRRDEDVPLVRWGFPILDRQGHQYFPTVGYKGGLRLLEKILNALLDRKDRDDPEVSFELVL